MYISTMAEFRQFCIEQGATEVDFHSGQLWLRSRAPLFSINYTACNGIALLEKSGWCLLTHYNNVGEKNTPNSRHPQDYLPRTLHEMPKKKNIEAALIAGDKNHQKQIKEQLALREIPVLAEYCDGWNNNITRFDKTNQHKVGKKGIFVHPRNRQIYLFSTVPSIGFKRLI